MKSISPSKRLRTASILLNALSFASSAASKHLQQNERATTAPEVLEWAVIGDSWASGVAYNTTNVYGPTDGEFCYRTKEGWGAQMANDPSWVSGSQKFNFAACGGSLMNDLERQMKDKAGHPDVVWGMFGGNNAFFGAIARACIYQPYAPEHPFGWGLPWDEDTDGKGICKQNIKKAEQYITDDKFMRKELTSALDDILKVAQDTEHKKDRFDLYLSSYVRFFDDTTDDCDKWSFGHDTVSSGHPKVVKGLRKEINQKVQQVNTIQADVVKGYVVPSPKLPNYTVRNAQPDLAFNGHRFCEKGRTFEDQYYHKDLWFWNLQYNDAKGSEQVGTVMTDKDGTKFMGSPKGFNETQGFVTVLGADNNPNAINPRHDNASIQQYGFGWTARPFHPKWDGHKALKDLFIQRMKDDKIGGVKTTTLPPQSTPAPQPQKKQECYGLGQNKYITRDGAKDIIENKFCPEAVNIGSLERKYNEGTPEEVTFRLQGPGNFKPSTDDCKNYLLNILIDGCDGNMPKDNPENFKGGGKETIGDVVYEIQPIAIRQPANKGKQGACSSKYKFLFNEYTVWGHGWDNSDHGDALKGGLKGCALLPDTWHFDYGNGDDGREWTAKFRTGVFQKKCVGHAGGSAGAQPGFICSGSG